MPNAAQGLADDRELVAQVVRGRAPGGLVVREAVGPERATDVEAAQDMVGLHVLEAAQDDRPEAERGVDELALAGRERRLEEREIGAVDEAVSVEEHEPFHCPSVAAGRLANGGAGDEVRISRPARRRAERRVSRASGPASQRPGAEQDRAAEAEQQSQDDEQRAAIILGAHGTPGRSAVSLSPAVAWRPRRRRCPGRASPGRSSPLTRKHPGSA